MAQPYPFAGGPTVKHPHLGLLWRQSCSPQREQVLCVLRLWLPGSSGRLQPCRKGSEWELGFSVESVTSLPSKPHASPVPSACTPSHYRFFLHYFSSLLSSRWWKSPWRGASFTFRLEWPAPWVTTEGGEGRGMSTMRICKWWPFFTNKSLTVSTTLRGHWGEILDFLSLALLRRRKK